MNSFEELYNSDSEILEMLLKQKSISVSWLYNTNDCQYLLLSNTGVYKVDGQTLEVQEKFSLGDLIDSPSLYTAVSFLLNNEKTKPSRYLYEFVVYTNTKKDVKMKNDLILLDVYDRDKLKYLNEEALIAVADKIGCNYHKRVAIDYTFKSKEISTLIKCFKNKEEIVDAHNYLKTILEDVFKFSGVFVKGIIGFVFHFNNKKQTYFLKYTLPSTNNNIPIINKQKIIPNLFQSINDTSSLLYNMCLIINANNDKICNHTDNIIDNLILNFVNIFLPNTKNNNTNNEINRLIYLYQQSGIIFYNTDIITNMIPDDKKYKKNDIMSRYHIQQILILFIRIFYKYRKSAPEEIQKLWKLMNDK